MFNVLLRRGEGGTLAVTLISARRFRGAVDVGQGENSEKDSHLKGW